MLIYTKTIIVIVFGGFMSYSRQREIVLAQIKKNKIHPTADEVYSKLKPDNPGLSLATVYRNLNLLSEQGVIGRVGISGKADRFDSNPKDHCHIICDCCGEVVDFENEMLDRLCDTAERNFGYRIKSCSIILSGMCPKCERERNFNE